MQWGQNIKVLTWNPLVVYNGTVHKNPFKSIFSPRWAFQSSFFYWLKVLRYIYYIFNTKSGRRVKNAFDF